MSVSDDKLRIPIEVKTEDIKEIEKLIQDITEAETDLRQILPKKGRGIGDVTSRSAFARPEPFDERGGIFGGTREGDVLPGLAKDKSSKQAFQRTNAFKEMQDELNQIKEEQSNILGNLINLGFAGSIGKGGAAAQAAAGAANAAKKALPAGQQTLTATAKGGIFGLMGLGNSLKSMIGKAGIYGFVALIVVEMVQEIASMIFREGGPFDRRFKRDITKESVRSIDLREKEEISQGRRIVRVTTVSGLRGPSQVRSNLDLYKQGQRLFDIDGSLIAKNTGVGKV